MTLKNKIWIFVGILLALGLIVAAVIWVKNNKKQNEPVNKPDNKPYTFPPLPPPDSVPPRPDDLTTNPHLPA